MDVDQLNVERTRLAVNWEPSKSADVHLGLPSRSQIGHTRYSTTPRPLIEGGPAKVEIKVRRPLSAGVWLPGLNEMNQQRSCHSMSGLDEIYVGTSMHGVPLSKLPSAALAWRPSLLNEHAPT